jgi:hypothetical protein
MPPTLEIDGTLPALTGRTLEAALVQEAWEGGERLVAVNALYLKAAGVPTWHRLFFDDGLLFVRASTTAPDARGRPAPADAFRYAFVDVGTAHGLLGRQVRALSAHAREDGTAELRLELSPAGTLTLTHAPPDASMHLDVDTAV